MSPLNATDIVTVRNLALAAGTKIVVAASSDTNSQIVVTGCFTPPASGTVAVDASVLTIGDAGLVRTLLTVPASNDLSTASFALDETTRTSRGYLTVAETETEKKLLLVANKVVTQLVTDSSASVKQHQTGVASSLLDKTHWSDGELPHIYADYFVQPDANNQAVHLFTPEGSDLDYVFPGESLSFKSWCFLYVACHRLSVKNLVLLGSNCRTYLTLARTLAPMDETIIDGGTVEIRSGSTARFAVWDGLFLRIDSEIFGAGKLVLDSQESTSSFQGSTYLTGLNTNFTGTIEVSMYSNYTPAEEKCQTLFVSDGRALGGALATQDNKALTLTRYGTLATTNAAEVVLAGDVNRGVYVDGNGQMLVGSHADAVTSLVLRRPLTLNGELIKKGSGTLVFDSTVAFGSDASATPTADLNKLTVRAGGIQVNGATAVDGMAFTFAEGTHLTLKPNPSDAVLMAKGICDVKTATPFTLGDGLEKLPLKIDLSNVSASQFETGFTCALVTVSDAAAEQVAAMMPKRLAGPAGAPKGIITRAVGTEAGTVTFSVTFQRRGLLMMVR